MSAAALFRLVEHEEPRVGKKDGITSRAQRRNLTGRAAPRPPIDSFSVVPSIGLDATGIRPESSSALVLLALVSQRVAFGGQLGGFPL